MEQSLIMIARQRLSTGVVSDILDDHRCSVHAMQSHVRPLDEHLSLFGRARTGLYGNIYHHDPNKNPYELEIDLIDSLQVDDVAVFACPLGNQGVAWGELLSTAARARGAVGCVTDGLVRDVRLIREMKFPVFAGGMGPLDTKGRAMVTGIDIPIECGGVLVRPNDWILGDVDGVVVIPNEAAEDVIKRALTRVQQENTVREEIARGEKLSVVFARHQTL
jgi:regulator of RNase E activity RraA